MASSAIKEIKESIKKTNHNFEDGMLVSDMAFKSIENHVDPSDIVFGGRINTTGGVLIGTSDKLFIVSKVKLSQDSCVIIPYSDITNLEVKSELISDKLIITAGRISLEVKLTKKESDYLVHNIKSRISGSQTINVSENNTTINANLKNVKLELLAQSFEKDFKLLSSQNALYFERKNNGAIETIQIVNNIDSLSTVTEENKKSIMKKAGWGFAGAAVGSMIFAPLAIAGLLAGVIAKGNKKEICFACELKTGEKFLAKTDNDTYQKLLALSL